MISPIEPHSTITLQRGSLNPPQNERSIPSNKDKIIESIPQQQTLIEEALSIEIAKPKSLAELMILFTNKTEELKTSLLKADIEHQHHLHESIVDSQKQFQEFLKKKRENAATASDIAYFEKIATGFLSAVSIGVGGMMASTMLPPLMYGGAALIGSGTLSLSALALEALGVDSSITKSISLSGMIVGCAATAIGIYLNPSLMTNSAFTALETSKAIFYGINTITGSESERKQNELEVAIVEERKKQELHRFSQEKIMTEVTEMIDKLNVSRQASKIIAQQQRLMQQYIQDMVQQRG